ncbi:MAG: aromatic amino acid lyase, partial [Candidatus Eremiobacteraeota bacterium]|nr:aromatic amino acid lyase [Candidatus Eremiobacteraeota bacterium]
MSLPRDDKYGISHPLWFRVFLHAGAVSSSHDEREGYAAARSTAAMRSATTLRIDGTNLSLPLVYRVACEALPVELDERARSNVRAARDVVERAVASNARIYGVTTGFGRLKNVKIEPAEATELQRNLIRSHAAGVGRPLDAPSARASMLLRAQSLARGHSGVRIELIELLLAMLNRGVIPVIPEQGSVGCSGDLAPLAHMALVLMGEGEAWYE